jgi:hypothetical protein
MLANRQMRRRTTESEARKFSPNERETHESFTSNCTFLLIQLTTDVDNSVTPKSGSPHLVSGANQQNSSDSCTSPSAHSWKAIAVQALAR